MTTNLYDSNAESRGTRRAARLTVTSMIGGVAIAALVAAMGGTASAAPAGESSGGTTTANVDVLSSIALTGLTPNFTLTGIPGATVTGTGDVTMTVTTNNLAGYAVTVESTSATLDGAAAGNTDTIPVSDLSVRESGTTDFTSLSNTAPVTVHTQATRSDIDGDAISNDYQVAIPFVNQDTYSTTLNYVATTL